MNQAVNSLLRCQECQADNPPEQTACWLCHAKLNSQNDIVMAELAETPPPAALSNSFFSILIGVSAVLVILVAIGIAKDSPGMLVFYGVLLVPPLLVTLCHSLFRQAMDKPVTPLQMFVTFMISAVVTVGIAVVLMAITIIVGVLYLIRLCFGGGA